MDIQTRKLNLLREIMALSNEEVIEKVENLLSQEKKQNKAEGKLSEKYAGKLPSRVAEELQDYVTQSRKEWGNRDI